jgi:hypothetical protein
VLSLDDRIQLLESDLRAVPMRISVYHDLPFAILRYDPGEEWELRKQVRLLETRLQEAGKHVKVISLGEILWNIIEEAEGIEAIVEIERVQGFKRAQDQITTYLSDPNWYPLPDALIERINALNPQRDVAFLTRAAVLSPAIYHLSKLLDEMQGRTRVPAILFFPGSIEGPTGLRYMALKDRESFGNYRVKIYG